MFHGRLYYILLVFCWMYALLKGGPAERIGTTILVVGSALSVAAMPRWTMNSSLIEIPLLLIDVACLIAFVMLSLRADRFWPIWMSALLGLGVLGHLGRWYAGSGLDRWVYAMSVAAWSYPMLALIVAGTWNHQRRTARLPTGATPPKARA